MNQITDDYPFVFVDPESVKLFELATKVAKTEIPAMITGPSGTGKEVLARVLHESSNRSNFPFVALNCAAIPDNLVEDTLFGHEKGAFTGAHQINKGFFEEAEGGTLFLDEIGEMPITLQSKLLRVLQEKQIYRVGATKPINVNVRIVSATNINIKHASTFRPEICRNAIHKLTNHDWPGNVRELENVILRAMVLLEGDRLLEEDIMFDDFSEQDSDRTTSRHPEESSNVFDLEESKKRFNWQPSSELEDILDALKMHSTRDKAAAELGISPRTLRQKLYEFRKAGLPVPSAYARS